MIYNNKLGANLIMVANLTTVIVVLMAFSFSEAQKLILPADMDDNFAHVPTGEVIINDQKHQSDEFYMFKSEVSNKDYNAFLTSIKESGNTSDLEMCHRHTQKWDGVVEQSEAYAKLYGSHESYDNYPVVNISLDAARKYCIWLGEKLNATHGSQYNIEVRLPSRIEWVRASRPKNIDDSFTWGGSFLISNTGDIMCNFKRLGSENIYWDETTKSYQVKEEIKISKYSRRIKERSTGVKSVDSFNPNKFGLYNMNGNIAELTSEGLACGGSWNSTGYDVRNESYIKYEEPSPMIGFRPVMIISKK